MITSKIFGKLKSGETVNAYTLSSKCGIEITILDMGGIIQSIKMPGKDGTVKDIVCGYDTPQEYLDNSGYNGALIGRYANRIENGAFTLNGKTYQIPQNEKGINAIHGGNIGFDKRFWNVNSGCCKCGADKLTLTYFSPDGEEGFPGNVNVKVIYRLTDDGEFAIRYFASSDSETPFAMTNHAYFNMAGYDVQCIYDQELTISSGHIVAVDKNLIPTELMDVTDTAFDFRATKKLGKDINGDEEQLTIVGGGYDHTFVIENAEEIEWNHGIKLLKSAILSDPESGRTVTVYTDAPGIQIYAGCYMGGRFFKNGVASKRHGAICLETGAYPNTPNRPDFPSCIIGPNKDYEYTSVFKFTV